MHLGAQRLGDLGAQVLADRAAGDAAEHLAEDETEGGHVVALRGARLPPRIGGGQPFADQIPVGDLLPVQALAWPDHPRPVTHHHRDGDGLLAGLAELGPVAGHRRVQVKLTALGELMDASARQSLGAGQHGGQRVHLPRPATGGVGRTSPQVDDQLAIHPGSDRCTHLFAQRKVLHERFAYPLEARCAQALDITLSMSAMAPVC